MSQSVSDIDRIRASYFRFYTTDSLKLGFSGDGSKISFGVIDSDGKALDQVGVTMNLRTTKMLAAMLTEAINSFEATSGVNVPFDESKIDELKKIIKASQAPKPDKPTN